MLTIRVMGAGLGKVKRANSVTTSSDREGVSEHVKAQIQREAAHAILHADDFFRSLKLTGCTTLPTYCDEAQELLEQELLFREGKQSLPKENSYRQMFVERRAHELLADRFAYLVACSSRQAVEKALSYYENQSLESSAREILRNTTNDKPLDELAGLMTVDKWRLWLKDRRTTRSPGSAFMGALQYR